MNKWYVVGKIGGILGTVTTVAIFITGFFAGVGLMTKYSRKKTDHVET